MYYNNDFKNFKELLELTAKTIGDALISIDTKGNCLFFNEASEDIFGSRLKSFLVASDPHFEYITYMGDGVTVSEDEDFPAKRVFKGELVTNEKLYVVHSGRSQGTWLLCSGWPMYDDKKNIVGASLIYHDQTAIIKNQLNERLMLEKLRQANVSKESLLKMLGHDLVNPIAAIRSLSDILLEEDDIDEAELKDLLRVIHTSAVAVQEIIGETVKEAVDSNETGMSYEVVTVAEAYKGAFGVLDVIAKAKNIEIKSSIDERVQVMGNFRALKRVVENLMTNAIKFSQKGSHVDVEISKEARKIVISVKDYGVGMNSEDVEKVMLEQKIDARIGTGGEASTGLGLPFIFKTVRNHYGQIKVISEPEKGTEFRITLPAYTAA